MKEEECLFLYAGAIFKGKHLSPKMDRPSRESFVIVYYIPLMIANGMPLQGILQMMTFMMMMATFTRYLHICTGLNLKADVCFQPKSYKN